jgi:SAM-dependent methyltransferase
MTTRDHQSLVSDQFGAHAVAYVTSTVHATGNDLGEIAGVVASLQTPRVLDLGCGGGHATFAAAPHAAEVTAFDLSAEMLSVVAAEATRRDLRNVVTRQGAVEALPFSDASFDVVLSRFSAHHWTDVAAGLAEARRVLKPGGKAVFIDVIAADNPRCDTWFQAIELLRDPSHVRNYSAAEWRRMLSAAGFTPGATASHRLRLEFTSWVSRLSAPEVHVRAIRALQARMPADVAAFLGQESDGSFHITSLTMYAS